MSYPYPEYSRPRRVDGGLKARSTRGAIGESWWSRRFLAVLESFALGSRLTRGRSYARQGQVLDLAVTAGAVTASVQGSRAKPYRVTIGLAPLPEPVWAGLEAAIAEQALFSARLLAGELPPEMEELFSDYGVPLFPAAVRDLTMACTCPDFAVPCKHIAATFYLLAEAFDADPFQLLRWRGRDRETLLAHLRGGAPPAPAAPSTVIGASAALADLESPPLDEALDRFWLPRAALPARPPSLETVPDLLLRQLPGPGAAIGGDDLADRLRAAYRAFAAGTPAR